MDPRIQRGHGGAVDVGESNLGGPAFERGIAREGLASAEDFLSALNPTDARWGADPAEWIYRGHANPKWKLSAKAFRSNAFSPYGILGDPLDWSQRKTMLDELLGHFLEGLDRSGIAAPANPPRLNIVGSIAYAEEPEREVFPLMALAQHHGLPTILLDWSRRSRVAAYFGAVEAANPETKDRGDQLVVWALRVKDPDDSRDPVSRQLAIYSAPSAANPNLRAQAGLFTVLRDGRDPDGGIHVALHPGALALENYIEIMAQVQQPGGQLLLRRLTLPTSEAPRLLRLLSSEGIDGAAMFPGADGVARAMREAALWDTP